MKKRLLSAIVSLCLLLTMVPTVAFAAEDSVSGGISWNITEGTLTISAADNPEEGYEKGEMPDYAYGQQPWNSAKSSIQNIVIQAEVTNIGERAFQDTNTAAVAFGDDVTSIGNWAFRNTKLTNVTIPGHVKTLGSYIFQLTSTLETITVDEGVEAIPNYCFQQATGLKTLNLPASIVSIGDAPLRQCAAVETITFGGTSQNSAKTYEVKDGMLIGNGTDLIALLKSAAEGSSLSIPNGIEKLGSYLLETNKTIQTLNFPASLNEIGDGALSNCVVASFTVDPANASFSAADDVLYGENGSELIFYPKTKADTSFTVPDTVKVIKNGAFNSNTALESVTLGANVETIEGQAFNNCTSLNNIEFDNALKSIGSYAFQNTGMTTISLPDSVEEIGDRAFFIDNSHTTTLIYFSAGSGLKKVGEYALSFKSAGTDSVLIDLTKASDDIELGKGAFTTGTGGGTNGYHQIYVKNDAVLSKVKSSVSGNNANYIVTANGIVTATAPTGGHQLAIVTRDNAEFEKYVIKSVTTNGHQHSVGETIDAYDGCGSIAEIEAVWECSIAFDANTGTGTMEPQTVTAGSSVTLPENSFVKAGYRFAGWNTQANGKGISYQDKENVQIDGNITLFAQWTPISYKITYELNGGSVEKENPETYTAEDTFTLNNPSKFNYTFAGWTGSNGDIAQTEVTIPVDSTGDKSYSANWKSRVLSDITVVAKNTNFTYGDTLNADNFTVTAVYDNGETEVLTADDFEITPATLEQTGEVEITVTGKGAYANQIATCTITVTRKSSHSSSSGSTTTTNTVSASTASNGKVSLDKSTAKKGDTVTITVTPDTGYELGKLTVTDAKGNTIAVSKKGDNQYTFTMPDGKVTVVPTFTKVADENPSEITYTDVADKDWFADAVAYVTNKGLMSGTGDNKFSPNASTTRGMLMTVLARYAGQDTTNSTPWYQAGMDWAKANGVSDGTNPTVNITREQLVTMLYRYAGSPAASGSLDNFSDASTVSTYAVNAMQWAVSNGIVNGSNGKLNPKNNATRAEVAAILMRFCEMSK